jgi:competence protein ComEC
MTRWEPSVIRAAGMAATVLVGRILGLPVDPWRALGGGVAATLVVAPGLAGSAGFHLSVAATAGLLLASHLGGDRRPRWAWRGLAASTSAQVAVLPLLIFYFGTVPLLAPLANVLAAPIVAAATIVSMFGVVCGSSIVVDGGVALADVVLGIARHAALGPQLGLAASLGVIAITASVFSRRMRVLGIAVALSAAAIAWVEAPVVAVAESVTVLDVGQGDAILVRGTHGGVMAVDTGPDPAVYVAALRRAGVTHVDLLVVTHGDADHVGGAVGLLERMSVGAIWVPRRRPPAPQVAELLDRAAAMGVDVSVPRPRSRVALGEVVVEVLGPGRRYDAENDESIVLWVAGPVRTMLLTGDIEAVAQRELPPLEPDVLLVPHHGSSTTDLEWLAATVRSVAIISVGRNTYGHPSPEVLDILERSDARTFVTSRDGDIVVPLGDDRVSPGW